MIETSREKVYQLKKLTPETAPVKKTRGRPKGSKNKPKIEEIVSQAKKPTEVLRKRGRPKGSKNKVKAEESKVSVKIKPRSEVREISTCRPISLAPKQKMEAAASQVELQGHPLYLAVSWLCMHMHDTQTQYYRTRASKNGTTVHEAMLADVLGFFNVQNSNILKLVKKNNFIAT